MNYKFAIIFSFLILLFGCASNTPDKQNGAPVANPPANPQDSGTPDTNPPITPPVSPEPKITKWEPPQETETPEIEVPPAPKFIDTVYAFDLDRNSKPLGRALVSEKTYELIAENKDPFKDYVRFTVLVDGVEVDSVEARCPESCANEKMYSVPLTVSEGEYTEIIVQVEDGSGAKGNSVSYRYAKSVSEAEYMAETCTVDATVTQYPSVSKSGPEFVSYGGTITEGWPEGTGITPYNISTDYSDICAYIHSNGIRTSGGRFFAATRWEYKYAYDQDVTPVPDRVACTCKCTSAPTNIDIGVTTSVEFPNWLGYDSANQCQKDHWDEFMINLKTHEEGHVLICNDGVNIIKQIVDSPSFTAEAATCQAACDEAVQKTDAEFERRFDEGQKEVSKKQKDYDRNTEHGKTQGAVLDCAAC